MFPSNEKQNIVEPFSNKDLLELYTMLLGKIYAYDNPRDDESEVLKVVEEAVKKRIT